MIRNDLIDENYRPWLRLTHFYINYLFKTNYTNSDKSTTKYSLQMNAQTEIKEHEYINNI